LEAFFLEMDDLVQKHADVACIRGSCTLVKCLVIDRFRESHDPEVIADAATIE
jgi:hypothetical protein